MEKADSATRTEKQEKQSFRNKRKELNGVNEEKEDIYLPP